MVGQTIAQYTILEKLGEGGMGIVYKARDTKLDRVVALKFLSTRHPGPENNRARFLQEARAAAALNHPNICTVIDINEADSEEFIVMEFIDGRSLRTVIDNGPMEIRAAVILARQIAEGLHAAHSRGIVHRDIKPENIIITTGGVAKIADFGLAALADEIHAPESLMAGGTIAYMSPEQVRGDPVDHRTDIWSLGVTLYEMVTGRRPFVGEYEQAVLYLVAHQKHAPVSELRPAIPSALEKIIDRCLEKDPALRVPDAAALAGELGKIEHALDQPEKKSLKAIAVLPFTDISPDKDNEYFSEGLTEEIIANLSKLRMVRVVSRTSVMQYERAEKSMKQIAADLAVQYILEGSVRKHGSDLRITTQLIDANQDASVWSEKYRGTMEDIFDIQETVAAKIVKGLKVRLTPGEKKILKRRSTENTEAYQLYLKGRFFWNKRSKTALETAIRYFEEALQKDPRYAPAWAGLSDSYTMLSNYASVPREEIFRKAKAAVGKALALDDQLAEAHTSLGSVMMQKEWDWQNAGKELRLAISLKPNYATAHHWYSEWLLYLGNVEDSLAEIAQAALLDPLSPAIIKDKGVAHYYAGQNDAAIEEATKALELDPAFASAHRLLSMAYLAKGMFAEAATENRLWEEGGGHHVEAALAQAQILAASGKKSEALAIIANVNSGKLDNGILFRSMALAYVALGEHDLAFQWLEKAYEARSEALCTLNVDPKMDPIRSDSRFHELLKKVGLGS